MKKLMILPSLILLSMFLSAEANPVHTYAELVTTIQAGNYFVIVTHFQACTGKPALPTTYFTPTAMLWVPATATLPEHVATDDLHFTDHSNHPRYEYVTYTFTPDNHVVVHTTLYDPHTFHRLESTRTFNCRLNQSVSVYTAALIAHD